MRMWMYSFKLAVVCAVMAGCGTSGRVMEPPRQPVAAPPSQRETPRSDAPRPVRYTDTSIHGAVIVIDPGHGGQDPGAPARGASQLAEKHLVLDIANKVADRLEAAGAKVIRTRRTDVFISLEERAAIAERNRADLFLSIHADSSQKKDSSGTGIHIHPTAGLATLRISRCFVKTFKAEGIDCQGVFRNDFHVLREHNRPGLLLECGYLTNTADARRLNTESYRAELADAIAKAATTYFAP